MELLSLNQLASLTGRSWRTTKKRLEGLSAAGLNKGGAVYDSRLALPLLIDLQPQIITSDTSNEGDQNPDYLNEKARLTKIQADVAALKRDRLAGKLVDREQTEKDFFSVGRIVRDSLLNIPDRLAPEFAAIQDIHLIRHRMIEEITHSLEELCKEKKV